MNYEKTYIGLHHSDYGGGMPQLALIDHWHKGRGFNRSLMGYYVGYGFVIEKSGQVIQTRTEEEENCQSNQQTQRKKWGKIDFNKVGIGICLAGDFSKEDPTDAQVTSLARLIFDLQERHGIPDDNVLLHCEMKDTSCPVKDLRALAFGQRKKFLQQELDQSINALRWAKADRHAMLLRKIGRLKLLITV